MRGEKGFERTDSILEVLGAGWTTSFLGDSLPGTLLLYNWGIPQNHYGIIYRSDSKTVRDVSSRRFH